MNETLNFQGTVLSNLKDFNNFTIFFLQAYRIFVIFISTDMLKIYYLRISDFQHLSEDELFPLVGEDTVRKVTGYKNPGVRRTKLLGEGMIRRLLFRLWGLHKEDYLIRIGEHGKPLVESRFSVWYNLSHSGDYIVAAFSHLEVGIDIEQKRKARMEVARRFFHPAEIQCLQNLAGDAQDELFFRYWSVKESFLKYTGEGLSASLSAFRVKFEQAIVLLGQGMEKREVKISECKIDPSYVSYICSGNREIPVLRKVALAELQYRL